MYLVSTKHHCFCAKWLDNDYTIKLPSESSLYNVKLVNMWADAAGETFEVKISYYTQFAAEDGQYCKFAALWLYSHILYKFTLFCT